MKNFEAKTKALELVDELDNLSDAMLRPQVFAAHNGVRLGLLASNLRSVIQDIEVKDPNFTTGDAAYLEGFAQGQRDANEWRKKIRAIVGTTCRVLKANHTVVDGHKMTLGRWYLNGIGIVDESEVLAWKPGESTELPIDWEVNE